MVHSTSLFRHNNRLFFFPFDAKSSYSNSLSDLNTTTLHFKRPILPGYSFHSSSPAWPSTSCHVARVSLEPLEFAPPAPRFNFRHEIARLGALRSKLTKSKTLKEKLSVIEGDSRVRRFFGARKNPGFFRILSSLKLDSYKIFLLKCLVAAGQEHVLSMGFDLGESEEESIRSSVKTTFHALAEMIENLDVDNGAGRASSGSEIGGLGALEDEEIGDLKMLLKTLEEIDKFYDCIGGILGYQMKVLELRAQSMLGQKIRNISHQGVNLSTEWQFSEIRVPDVLNLSENTEHASRAALWGIEGLPDLGEIYPLGGSADRLSLLDPETGECLPAAMLPYCGRTLLEGLIRDLQAREFLYFKLYKRQCITPVAIMTSSAKKNHDRITSLCKNLAWFGRGQSTFQIFEQPLVPAISAEDGQWLVTKPLRLIGKPGGHGVLWKLAHDKGIFKWFYDHGRKAATVRQVSNVVAATDLTLLALAGIGLQYGKKLGFASCKRNLGATEGINVLMEKKSFDGNWAYGLSSIEYTEFNKYGIRDGPLSSKSLEANFPANTNILYVDLPSAELVGSSNNESSLPGMVLNTKKPVVYTDHLGRQHGVCGGRLECTMQNIADNYFKTFSSRCYNHVEDKLDTFIVYNERRKVTSSAKRKRKQGEKSLHQTPDGALMDMLRNAHNILSECSIKLPEIEGNDKYASSGPPFLIHLHPALGPVWEVIRQKFNGGSISLGSELQVEVAEFLWKNVQLDGSLIIVAENIMGSMEINGNGEPILQYGQRCGRCKLKNVKVLNAGVDWDFEGNIYWKHDFQRSEVVKIILHGNAEFEATDITFQGNHVFEVPNGYKLCVTSGFPDMVAHLDPIEPAAMESGSWHWNYKVEGTHIRLESPM